MRDIMSSLKNHLRQKEDELPRAAQAAQLMQNRTPQGERGGTSVETQLADAREAHWRALATTITLEEKIEGLSQSLTRDCPDAHAPSQSQKQWRRRFGGRAEGATKPYQRVIPLTPQHIALHDGGMKRLNLTWDPHQSWRLMWSGSSRGQLAIARKRQEDIFWQNPQQRSMKSGYSREDKWWLSQVGGRSWR